MFRIYVGNLSFRSTPEGLRELFAAHGDVLDAFIGTDRETGRSRGFGFVTMADREAGTAAIAALNGKEFEGRTLTVSEAQPRAERSSSGGPGGGHGTGGPRGGGGSRGGEPGGPRGGGGRGGFDGRRDGGFGTGPGRSAGREGRGEGFGGGRGDHGDGHGSGAKGGRERGDRRSNRDHDEW
jgi:RNA recognition motif-containing protein